MLLAVVLTLVGSCGVVQGVGGVSAGRPPMDEVGQVEGERPAVEEAAESSARALVQTLWESPLRRPLAAANVVVSILLLVAAMTLLMRRASAIWWVTQAAIANVLWTVVHTGSQIAQLLGARERLVALFEREIEARLSGAETEQLPWQHGSQQLWLYVALFVAFGLARIAIYGWVTRRARRPDVRELVDLAAEERGDR